MEVDLVGVVDFEVIEIMHTRYPYSSSLLGIDWEYENYVIIDLKRETMTFEANGMNVILLLDPYHGLRYTKLAHDVMERDVLNQIYHVTSRKRVDYINPTVDRSLGLKTIYSFGEDSKESMEDYYYQTHKIYSQRCATIESICWIGKEL